MFILTQENLADLIIKIFAFLFEPFYIGKGSGKKTI